LARSVENWFLDDSFMEKFWLIGLGGFLGANARYLVSGWAAERWGASFPFGTLLVNVTGSLVLGFFLTLANERALIDPRLRLFLAIGFVGAYTTFSTYAFESFAFLGEGQGWLALLNLLSNNLISLVGVLLGSALARWLV
jgi:CrcB protein